MYAVFAAMQDFLKTRGMELNINAKATLAKLNLMMRNELEIKPLPLPRLLKWNELQMPRPLKRKNAFARKQIAKEMQPRKKLLTQTMSWSIRAKSLSPPSIRSTLWQPENYTTNRRATKGLTLMRLSTSKRSLHRFRNRLSLLSSLLSGLHLSSMKAIKR